MSATISSSKKGILYRQSKNTGVWQKRYCSVTGSFLTLYKSSEYSSQSLVAMVDLAQVEEVFISDRANPSFPHTPTPLPESPNSLNTNHYIVLQMKSKNLSRSDQRAVGKGDAEGVTTPLSIANPSSDENAHPQSATFAAPSPKSPQPQIFTLRAESYSQASYWVGLLSYVRGRAKGGKKSAVPFGKKVAGKAVSAGRPPSSALSKISEIGEGEGGEDASVNMSMDFDPYLSLNSSLCLDETSQLLPSANPTPTQPHNLSYSDSLGLGVGIGVVESPLHMKREESLEKMCEMLGEMMEETKEEPTIVAIDKENNKVITQFQAPAELPTPAVLSMPAVGPDTESHKASKSFVQGPNKSAKKKKIKVPLAAVPTIQELPTPSPFPSLSCPTSPLPVATSPPSSYLYLKRGLGMMLLLLCMGYHLYTPSPLPIASPGVSQPSNPLAFTPSVKPQLAPLVATTLIPSVASTPSLTNKAKLEGDVAPGMGAGKVGGGGVSIPTRLSPLMRLLQALRNIFTSPIRLWKKLGQRKVGVGGK